MEISESFHDSHSSATDGQDLKTSFQHTSHNLLPVAENLLPRQASNETNGTINHKTQTVISQTSRQEKFQMNITTHQTIQHLEDAKQVLLDIEAIRTTLPKLQKEALDYQAKIHDAKLELKDILEQVSRAKEDADQNFLAISRPESSTLITEASSVNLDQEATVGTTVVNQSDSEDSEDDDASMPDLVTESVNPVEDSQDEEDEQDNQNNVHSSVPSLTQDDGFPESAGTEDHRNKRVNCSQSSSTTLSSSCLIADLEKQPEQNDETTPGDNSNDLRGFTTPPRATVCMIEDDIDVLNKQYQAEEEEEVDGHSSILSSLSSSSSSCCATTQKKKALRLPRRWSSPKKWRRMIRTNRLQSIYLRHSC